MSHLLRQLITPCHEHQHRDAANTRHSANVVSMLCHRLRRWPNIDPTLAQSLVFAGDRLFVVIRCSHISAALFNPANTILWNNDVLMLGQRRRRWANIKKHCFKVLCLLGRQVGSLRCINSRLEDSNTFSRNQALIIVTAIDGAK